MCIRDSICLLLHFFNIGFGQAKFQKGYVLTQNDQKIEGSIKLEATRKLQPNFIINSQKLNKDSVINANLLQSIHFGENNSFLKVEEAGEVFWLKKMWNVGEIQFFERLGNTPSYFYKKDGVLSKLSNTFKKVNLEAFRTADENKYLLPNGKKIVLPSKIGGFKEACLLYTSPSPRDATLSRMPSSA